MVEYNQRDPARPTLWKTFFIFCGISTLFVWNSVLSQTSYWAVKIAPGIQNYFGFPVMLGGFICFFLYDPINRSISYRKQIILWPSIMSSMFIVFFVVGETIESTTIKCVIFLVGCFIQGFINNILQMSQCGFIMSFTVDEIRWYNGGTGMAGIGASQLNYILTYIPVSVGWQCMIYLILVMLVLASIIVVEITFCNYFIDSKDVKENELKMPLKNKEDANANDVLLNIRKKVYIVVNSNEQADTWAQRWIVWKKIYPITTLMWWCYVVTQGVFPVLVFNVGAAMPTAHNFAFCTLIYNIGDFTGKWYSNLLPLKDGKLFYSYGALRGLVLSVLFAICVMYVKNPFWGSPIFTIILNLLLGITNGHITTYTFGICAGRVKPEEIGTGAGLIVIHLLFGLVFGSLVDALAYLQ